MRQQYGVYLLDVDADRTQAYYRSSPELSCDCDGCRNYRAAISHLSPAMGELLCGLGIDPAKPAEISVLYAPEEKELLYAGFFYVTGTILQGRDPWEQLGPRLRKRKEEYLIHLGETMSVSFTEECRLLDPEFPRPTLQVDVSFSLPWVMEEPNPYTLTAGRKRKGLPITSGIEGNFFEIQ